MVNAGKGVRSVKRGARGPTAEPKRLPGGIELEFNSKQIGRRSRAGERIAGRELGRRGRSGGRVGLSAFHLVNHADQHLFDPGGSEEGGSTGLTGGGRFWLGAFHLGEHAEQHLFGPGGRGEGSEASLTGAGRGPSGGLRRGMGVAGFSFLGR